MSAGRILLVDEELEMRIFLANLLKRCEGKYQGKLVVVDGIFSMDGDIAPLPEIVELAERYKARVMVDEAHATGVVGPDGRIEHAWYNVRAKGHAERVVRELTSG